MGVPNIGVGHGPSIDAVPRGVRALTGKLRTTALTVSYVLYPTYAAHVFGHAGPRVMRA